MQSKNRDALEVAIAGFIGLAFLLAGAYILAPLKDRQMRAERPILTQYQLAPSPDKWYADACGKGECDD